MSAPLLPNERTVGFAADSRSPSASPLGRADSLEDMSPFRGKASMVQQKLFSVGARASGKVGAKASMIAMTSRVDRHLTTPESYFFSRGRSMKVEDDIGIQVDENGELAVSVPDGSSSLVSSVVALVSTCLGTGLLALPSAFSTTGIELGLGLLILFCLVSGFSSWVLTQSSEWATVFTYEGLMVAAFGEKGSYALGGIVVVLLLGAMTGIVVVCTGAVTFLLEAFMSSLVGDLDGPLAYAWECRKTVVMLSMVFGIIFPLSRGASSPAALAKSNNISMACVLLTLMLLVIQGVSVLMKASSGGAGAEPSPVDFLPTVGTTDIIQVLKVVPIISLGLGCQVQVPCVYGDLNRRSLGRMGQTLGGVGIGCALAYGTVGVMGLVAVFQVTGAANFHVQGSVLDSLSPDSPSAMAMRGLMALGACMIYPMLLLPCRSTVDSLVMAARGMDEEEMAEQEEGKGKSAASAVVIMGLTVFFAWMGGNLSKVFALTGASAGSLICYMLPPACFISLRKRLPEEERGATRVQCVLCYVLLVCFIPLSSIEVYLQFV